MPLQPYQLTGNARVNLAGSEGHVVRTDNDLTCVAREDGSVDWYTTEHVTENADVVLTDAEQSQVQSDQDRIDQLESELARIRAGEGEVTPAPGPAATSTVPGQSAPAAPAPDQAAPTQSDQTAAPEQTDNGSRQQTP